MSSSDLLGGRGCFKAPIALFVYNRPWHTQQTVEALQKNESAADSDLFIFSDAAKNQDSASAVQQVRDFIKTVSGFRAVNIVEREHNLGLAASIIAGVTQLCNEFGRVIVLEDDLVTSPYFLRFMNDSLDFHKNSERVMHISGSTYPVGEFCADSSYFLRLPLCWGWATWSRAWANFCKDIDVMGRFDRRMISRFNFDGTYDYWKQLELNRSGAMNTWFVFWYSTVFLNDGLVLFPRKSLVKNIGMDGSGVHCGKTSKYDVEVASMPIELSSIAFEESERAYASHKRYFRSISPSLRTKVFRKLAKILRRLLVIDRLQILKSK